jgi:hypothetical protein
VITGTEGMGVRHDGHCATSALDAWALRNPRDAHFARVTERYVLDPREACPAPDGGPVISLVAPIAQVSKAMPYSGWSMPIPAASLPWSPMSSSRTCWRPDGRR